MSLNFAANLNFLFTEAASIAERMHLAHKAGFRAVEIPYPRSQEQQVIKAQQVTGLHVSLLNNALGTTSELQMGAASIPGAEQHFKTHFEETLNLAKQLKCPKIHLMSGLVAQASDDEHFKTYVANLKYAVRLLEQEENLVGVIEPINKYSVPNYYMNSYDLAITVIKAVNSIKLKILWDMFHRQIIQGNIETGFKEFSSFIGHVQFAQVPSRNEPDVSGELDYGFIFGLLERMSYKDWIGCEYKPKTTTTEGLKWLAKFNQKL